MALDESSTYVRLEFDDIELGVPLPQVLVTGSATDKVPNASATAASSGTDLNGRAAQYAARNVRDNLASFVCGLDGCGAGAIRFAGGQVISPKTVRSFEEVVQAAYANRIQLWSDGFYRTPKIHYDKTTLTGRPFFYFAYGAACSEVAIDTLTGEYRVLGVDILHDVGRSINPAVDIGQIEGGFIQGMGWLTTEELVWDDKGQLTTKAPSTYKIPTGADLPPHFNVHLWPEPNEEDTIFRSKAVGEPPLLLPFSSSDREVGVLDSVVFPQPTRPVQMPQIQLIQSGSVRRQAVGSDRLRLDRLIVKEPPDQLQRSLRIPPALDQEVEDLAFVIDSPPQIHPLSADRTDHLIKVPARRWNLT